MASITTTSGKWIPLGGCAMYSFLDKETKQRNWLYISVIGWILETSGEGRSVFTEISDEQAGRILRTASEVKYEPGFFTPHGFDRWQIKQPRTPIAHVAPCRGLWINFYWQKTRWEKNLDYGSFIFWTPKPSYDAPKVTCRLILFILISNFGTVMA